MDEEYLKKAEVLLRGRKDRKVFINEIFSQSFSKFIGGKYIDEVAEFYGKYQNTIRVSPRDHFKSTGLYAAVMYDILYTPVSLEGHYFSYKYSLSVYHLGKIKDLIAANPYFSECIDQTRGKGRIDYLRGDIKVTVSPHSMLGFKRGIHALRLYIDDPFQDPSNMMNQTILFKINDIFVNQIMNMLTQGGRLHVTGTPQSTNDFFFNKDITKGYGVMIKPAIISRADQIALWPEYMPYAVLMQKEAIDARSFAREFMCQPVYSENSYFKEPQIQACINPKLRNYGIYDTMPTYNDVIAGFDIGKKSHPSHLAVFEKRGDLWCQIHSKFMDQWDYSNGQGIFDGEHPTQLEYLKLAVKNFGIDKVYWDATRGEFESFVERGLLPVGQFEGVIFNSKTKQAMAAEFGQSIQKKQLQLLDDQRQSEQILMVTNDLKALETPMGHGDSFWSIGLAHMGMSHSNVRAGVFFKDEKVTEKTRGITGGLLTTDF